LGGNPAIRGRGHARQLDREQIFAVARELARSQGPRGVTMRAIARVLDVDVAALYWHFESKAELLDALSTVAASGEPLLAAEAAGEWQDRTRALCRSIRTLIRQQPELRVVGHRAFAPFTMQCVAALCRALTDSGLPSESTLFAAQTLVQTVFAIGTLEAARAAADPTDNREYVESMTRGLPESFVASWASMARRDPRETFETFFEESIGFVIGGIAARGGPKSEVATKTPHPRRSPDEP
jgi:TetR/AcrR family tetracycline transcriptional repressor